MNPTPPSLFIVIGANGAGKTTWTGGNRNFLPEAFYNADSIAEGVWAIRAHRNPSVRHENSSTRKLPNA